MMKIMIVVMAVMFYKVPAGHIDLCNVPLPVRPRKR